MKKSLISILVAGSLLLGPLTVDSIAIAQQCSGLFPDVKSTNGFCNHIEYLYKQGVVGGYSDGRFHSDDLVTRGQFAKMVVHAFQLGVGLGDESFFDVPSTNKFYHEIVTLKALGIINGYSDGSFRPDERVTRGAALKFIVNAARESDSSLFPTIEFSNIKSTFNDLEPTHTFAEYIARANSVNDPSLMERIVGGYSDGTFRPDTNMTRGQVAKVLTNSMKYAKTESVMCIDYYCNDLNISNSDGRFNGSYFDLDYDKSFWTVESDDLLGSIDMGEELSGQYGFIGSSQNGESIVLFMAMDMSNPEDPDTKMEDIFKFLADLEGKSVNEYFGSLTMDEVKDHPENIGSSSIIVKNSGVASNGVYRTQVQVSEFDYNGVYHNFDGYMDLNIKGNNMYMMIGLSDNSGNLAKIESVLNAIQYK
jgi:hypothetical protein